MDRRLGFEIVIVVALVVAILLYVSQSQTLTNAENDLATAASQVDELTDELSDAQDDLADSATQAAEDIAAVQAEATAEVDALAGSLADAEATVEVLVAELTALVPEPTATLAPTATPAPTEEPTEAPTAVPTEEVAKNGTVTLLYDEEALVVKNTGIGDLTIIKLSFVRGEEEAFVFPDVAIAPGACVSLVSSTRSVAIPEEWGCSEVTQEVTAAAESLFFLTLDDITTFDVIADEEVVATCDGTTRRDNEGTCEVTW